MGWLHRIRRSRPTEAPTDREGPPARPAPGIVALFEDLDRNGTLTLLDLGPATEQNLRFHGRYARRVRFADLPAALRSGEPPDRTLEGLVASPEHPYDLVLGWNVLDLTAPDRRPALVAALVRLTRPGSRLHLMVDMSGAKEAAPIRFTIVDRDRVSRTEVGPPLPALGGVLPAGMEPLVSPFKIVRAFVLRDGFREYVAVRE